MNATGTADDEESDLSSRSISFRQLRLFETVGRLGSVSRAANACGLTQPAATQSMATLAHRVGFALLDGDSKGVALTPCGRDLHQRLTLLLSRLERGLDTAGIQDRDPLIWRLSQAQVRLLDAAAERGSVERAALVLGMTTRSALRTLRALEALSGQTLLHREDGAVVLTAAGQALARQIGRLADEVEWIVSELREAVGREGRSLVVGVAPDPGTASLSAIVKAQVARHPAWRLEVLETGQSDLLARLAIGEADLVVGHILGGPGVGLAWEQIASAAYRIVGRRDHPLAGKRVAALSDLAHQTWIFGARGSQRRAASDTLFSGSAQPLCCLVTSAPPLMAQVMAESDCLGLMTDQELAQRRDALVEIRHAAPRTLARIGLARRADWRPGPVHQELIEAIKARFAAMSIEG